MTDDVALSTLRAFCRSHELSSFSAAAKNLGLSPTAVSRSLSRLEVTLGVQLFRRTTRKFEATAAGHAYYQACRQALSLLDGAERDLREEGEVRGTVRISAPTTFGNHILPPMLARFHRTQPEVELELHVGNQNVDFVREGFDLAIRMGVIREAGLVARSLGRYPLITVASQAYLETHGTPKELTDLERHVCIGFVMPRTGRALPWLFEGPSERYLPRSRVRITEDPSAGVALACAGVGVYQMYEFMLRAQVRTGELVEVLKHRAGAARPFSLIYPVASRRSAATRSVIDYLTRACGPRRAAE